MRMILRTESTEEDVSEEEDDVQYDPEQEDTSDEEEDLDDTYAQREVFRSRKGDISSSSSPYDTQCRAPTENIIKMTQMPTRYALLHAQDIKTIFELFIPPSLEKILLDMTNMEGKRVFGNSWTRTDKTQLRAYIGLLLPYFFSCYYLSDLSCVVKSDPLCQ